MKNILHKFWSWYDRHLVINLGISTFLFALQIVHLYWLTTHVVTTKAFGITLFNPGKFAEGLITVVDYFEIPAIVSTSVLYVNTLRKKYNLKSLLLLIFVNSQWLHLYWITDEYVVEHFFNHHGSNLLPIGVAWLAILIDYLELPVIFDTIKTFSSEVKKGNIKNAVEALRD